MPGEKPSPQGLKHPDRTGLVSAVLVAPDPKSLVSVQRYDVEATLEGIRGDRHFGATRRSGSREKDLYPIGTEIKNNRQFTLVSEEQLEEIAARLLWRGTLLDLAGVMGANIVTRGISENVSHLRPSTRLLFSHEGQSSASLVVDGENLPCIHPGREILARQQDIDPTNFPKAAMGRRGTVGWVEKPGTISVGDTVKVVSPR